MKRVFSLLVAAVMVCLAAMPAAAVDYGCSIDTVSDAVYLENLDSGITVFEKNADAKMSPASTTKVMTYIVVAENVPDFDGTMVEVTAEALSTLDPESSIMGLEAHIGESFSVRDLLYGLMVPSGNDAALVLADFVGHGIDGFVNLMNRKAAQLGCEGTHFVSPHGLYDANHYSTARDMATITKYAMEKDGFMEIVNTTRYTPALFEQPIETTNYLIDSSQKGGYYYYPYAKGIKTGFTDEAGRCLISSAERDGYRYLCVALGAEYSYVDEINYAMLDTAELYDWALDNLSNQVVYSSTEPVRNIGVAYKWGDYRTDLVPASEIVTLLPNGYDTALVSVTEDCAGAVEAPVTAGEKVGTLTVYYDGEKIGSTDIVTSEDIDRDETNYLAHVIVDFCRDHFIVLLIVVLLLIGIIIMASVSRRRRRIEREKRRYR